MGKWCSSAISAIAISVLMGFASSNLVATPQQGSALGPGCAPDRPAIAHHAGGVRVPNPPGAQAPVPCSIKLNMRVGEESLVITKTGSVLLRPAWRTDGAGPETGVVRLINRGAKWTMPVTRSHDTNMWADPLTGRVFWLDCGARCKHPIFYISDDDGEKWYPGGRPFGGPTDEGGLAGYDHSQVFGGPPVAGMKHLMGDYPNVVYICMGHDPLKCQKSLNGGMSWGPVLPIPFPKDPAVKSLRHSQLCSEYGLQGVVGADGTVYVPYGPCNRPYVAISRDEGKTWQPVAVANTNEIGYGYPSLGMDAAGNLYAAWVSASNRMPYMAISRDHGMHWGKAVMIAAPGVNEAAIPHLVTGREGQVAVTYYGSKNAPHPFPPPCFPVPEGLWGGPYFVHHDDRGPTPRCAGYENERWDTYVTETWNALDRQPLFWSATLNPPDRPTWYGLTPSEIGVVRWNETFRVGGQFFRGGYPRLIVDYYGAAMAPDGTVWVGFVQECPYGRPSSNPNCPSGTGSNDGGLFGFVGRLVPR